MGFVARAAASLSSTLLVTIAIGAAAVTIVVKVFDLRWTGALALYFVVWWILLFAVLPFGHGGEETSAVPAGTDPAAPANPRLREKAIWTTLLSAATLVLVAWLFPLTGL